MEVSDHFKLCPVVPGRLLWARDSMRLGGFKLGDVVKTYVQDGYHVVGLRDAGRAYTVYVHRVVYCLTHGCTPDTVDHRDNDRANNHPDNLRDGGKFGNAQNKLKNSNNKTGVKGLSWDDTRGRWVGRIRAAGKLHTKVSTSRAVVESWLSTARPSIHGEFSNHG